MQIGCEMNKCIMNIRLESIGNVVKSLRLLIEVGMEVGISVKSDEIGHEKLVAKIVVAQAEQPMPSTYCLKSGCMLESLYQQLPLLPLEARSGNTWVCN
jgi:hypothetical protein